VTSPTQDPNDTSNPLTRSAPLGGRTGVALASIVPIIALALFLLFGFLGGWAWSWVFFLAIPVVFLVVYGPRDRRNRSR
jgi:membrane protein implicated in regulation of membrane protease activity